MMDVPIDNHNDGPASIQTEDEYQHNSISQLRDDSNVPWHRRKSVRYTLLGAVVLVVIIVIAVPVSNANKAAASANAKLASPNIPVIATPEVSPQEHESNQDDLSATLLTYYNTYSLDWKPVTDASSPQALSVEWVAGEQQYKALDAPRRIQRYVLAVLYYSTFNVQHSHYNTARGDVPQGWTSALNWISAEHECDWEGVTCEGDAVVGLLLREHSLSGSLPLELAFLSTSLLSLDFTSNFLYMDGDATTTPLSHLDHVATLLLEDNYVYATNGLPNGMDAMTALKKVTLSYNLLQGPFNGAVFGKLAMLTHLDVESNYIAGTLPSELLKLPDLVDLYIRSNLLELHLPTVLGNGTWPSLYAVWMDSNNVTGPIPPSIADKKGLASFSITNTTLHGPIPTEIGLLTGLRRVWLYNNDLTGSVPTQLAALSLLEVLELHGNPSLEGIMPSGICTTIKAAEFEFKSLTATCASLDCDCCTECY